jgi:hypothetical protein
LLTGCSARIVLYSSFYYLKPIVLCDLSSQLLIGSKQLAQPHECLTMLTLTSTARFPRRTPESIATPSA